MNKVINLKLSPSLAVISLPHEIQRNLTMIREHDSQVQGNNDWLYRVYYKLLLINFSAF